MVIINMNETIKHGDGNMVTMREDIVGIDDKERKRVFFDSMNFESKRFKKKRVVFRVCKDVHNAMIKLQESGIFEAEKGEMYRGLICLGLIDIASQKGLCRAKVEAISRACKGSRVRGNIKKLDEALECLDRDVRTKDMLEYNIKKHGNNAYGAKLNLFLEKSEITKGGSSKIVVQPNIEKHCRDIIAKIKWNSIFYIPKEKGLENPTIDIRLPKTLTFIAYILIKNYDTPKVSAEIYRAAFTTGLQIICNWIIQNKIPEDEYNFCKILHNIYDYLTDHHA